MTKGSRPVGVKGLVIATIALGASTTLGVREARAVSGDFQDAYSGHDWTFYKNGGVGNGYLSSRPSVARSLNFIGDLYDNGDPSSIWESLSKTFTLGTSGYAAFCEASVYIRPQTKAWGILQLSDPLTGGIVASQAFSFSGASSTWTKVSTSGSGVSGTSVVVAIKLVGNGTWQEFFIDDLAGFCAR